VAPYIIKCLDIDYPEFTGFITTALIIDRLAVISSKDAKER